MDLYPLSVEGLPEDVKTWFDTALRNIALRAVKDYLKISTIYHKARKILIEWYPSRNEGTLSYRGKVIGMYQLSQGELYQVSYEPLRFSQDDGRSSYTELYTVGGLEADIMADYVGDIKYTETNYPACSAVAMAAPLLECPQEYIRPIKTLLSCTVLRDSYGNYYVIPISEVGEFSRLNRGDKNRGYIRDKFGKYDIFELLNKEVFVGVK